MTSRPYLSCISDTALRWALDYRGADADDKTYWLSDHHRRAFDCLCEPTLETAWERADKFDVAGHLTEDEGQVVLLNAIADALEHADIAIATESQTEAWKSKMLKIVEQLAAHLDQAPSTLNLNDSLYELASATLLNSCWIRRSERELACALAMPTIEGEWLNRSDTGTGLGLTTLFADAVHHAQHTPVYGQGAHGRGPNVKRSRFVCALAARLHRKTGQQKLEIVALVTSYLYACDYSVQEVHRAITRANEYRRQQESPGISATNARRDALLATLSKFQQDADKQNLDDGPPF